MRVLVAEDNKDSQNLIKLHLVKEGYEVITADDGQEALEIFHQGDFRLIVTDWIMPKMGGVELCQKIRESSSDGYAYIILLTAKEEKKDLVQAMAQGADDYITKPYDRGELIARIRAGQRIVTLEQELSNKNRELTTANERMEKDLIAARELQLSFLPKKAPNVPGISVSWFYEPCERVGGDTFSFFNINDEYILFYVADVSGHGVPAAMLSVTLSRIMRPNPRLGGILVKQGEAQDSNHVLSPSKVAELLNRRFPMDSDVGQYFTLLYGTLHLPSQVLKVVQAGHPYLLLLGKDGKTDFHVTPGFPIGMFDEPNYKEETIQLSERDSFFFYSDGIIEAENHDGMAFGNEGLVKAVKNQQNKSITETTEKILKSVFDFCEEKPIGDDMTLVGISIGD